MREGREKKEDEEEVEEGRNCSKKTTVQTLLLWLQITAGTHTYLLLC